MYNNFSEFIPKNKHTEKLIQDIKKAADDYIGTQIPSLKYSDYCDVFKTYDRLNYEEKYIEHRRRLNVFLIMVLYDGSTQYINELQDILWAICDEFSWCLPAHMHIVKGDKTVKDIVKAVDIFAAETVFYLSEAVYLTKNKIDSMVYNRVKYEITRRVITPYLTQNLNWAKNNWSGVCASSIGMALIYLDMKKEFGIAKNNILNSINDFLLSYDKDGCCKEGALYWVYGFGFFCYFAQLLREFTNGKINLFKNEKVKKTAEFGNNVYTQKNNTIPFSDAPHELKFNAGLFTFLSKEYGFSVPPLQYESCFGDDVRYRMCHMIRDFYWYDEDISYGGKKPNFKYYENSMWYINRKENFVFAAKGGNNCEPHNHNDLGSFILYDDGKYIIDDLGWPVYGKGYFDIDTRYSKYICASSRGHSVPQIDGGEQLCSENGFAELIDCNDSCFILDLSNAYDTNCKIIRKFSVYDNIIKIIDTLPDNSTERFVTRIKPQVLNKNGLRYVRIANWDIRCEDDCFVNIYEETFKPRNTIVKSSMKDEETAYLIDFTPKEYKDSITISIYRRNCNEQ